MRKRFWHNLIFLFTFLCFLHQNTLTFAQQTASQSGIYIYPGIDSQEKTVDKYAMASRYTLTCGAEIVLSGNLTDEGKIGTLEENYVDASCSNNPGACVIPQVTGTVFINHEQTTIPLYRLQGAVVPSAENPDHRTDDLEGFFNASYPEASTQEDSLGQFIAPLANGVAAKLLSKEQKCEDRILFLQSVKLACQKGSSITNPVNNPLSTTTVSPANTSASSDCALDLSIPGTSYTYTSLIDQKPSTFSCFDLGDNTTPSQAEIDWEMALSKVEVSTPRGFRPAYIVHYVDLPAVNTTNNPPNESTLTRFQTWFGITPTNPEVNLEPRITITKVYVPANFSQSGANIVDTPSSAPVAATFVSGFMRAMQSMLPLGIQQNIETQKEKLISDIFTTSQQPNMQNPEGVVDAIGTLSKEHIECPECTGDNLSSILVRRINAEDFVSNSPLIGNTTCNAIELHGEKATQVKQEVNPAGNPDPVHETSHAATADLKAKGERGTDEGTNVRTYLLLPEEYRDVQNYEQALANTITTDFQQQNNTIFPTDFAKSLNGAYKYLQLSDTKPKNGTSGDTVHVSSPAKDAAGPIGANLSTHDGYDPLTGKQYTYTTREYVTLSGQINGSGENFDVNPQVPGGLLARSIWEILCNITRPANGIKTVEYSGLEKLFLSHGISACTSTAEISTTTPTDNSATEYMNTEVAVCNGSSGGITVGNGLYSQVQLSDYICSDKQPDVIKNTKQAWVYQESLLNIPNWTNSSDGDESICNQNFYSFVACTYSPSRASGKSPYPTLIAHLVDSSGKFTSSGTMTACQYVVQQAKARGVSPRLALAMWGEESGFSSASSTSTGQDFGVVSQPSSRKSGSISQQVTLFLGTVNSHVSGGYLDFLRSYSGETTPTPVNFCNNKFFPYRLKDLYNAIP